jgi:hypothetical protein
VEIDARELTGAAIRALCETARVWVQVHEKGEIDERIDQLLAAPQ